MLKYKPSPLVRPQIVAAMCLLQIFDSVRRALDAAAWNGFQVLVLGWLSVAFLIATHATKGWRHMQLRMRLRVSPLWCVVAHRFLPAKDHLGVKKGSVVAGSVVDGLVEDTAGGFSNRAAVEGGAKNCCSTPPLSKEFSSLYPSPPLS